VRPGQIGYLGGSVDSATWRKSSFSGSNGGNCIESASVPGAVLVRDTTDREGPALGFTPEAWARFTKNLKKQN
jgi:Domain of unknown function (DUF397)